MKIALLSGGIPFFQSEHLTKFLSKALRDFGQLTVQPPQVTDHLPTKQPRRKTGVAQSRRDARKRRNRK